MLFFKNLFALPPWVPVESATWYRHATTGGQAGIGLAATQQE